MRKNLSLLLLLFSFYSYAQYTLQDSLVAHYTLNGDATDSSGNMHNGIVYGAVASADRNGVSGGCLQFDGMDDYLDLGNIIDVSLQSEMSISAWFYVEQSTSSINRYCGVSFGKKDSGELTLRVMDENLNKFQSALYTPVNPASSSSSTSNIYTLNNWYHAVGIYENGAVSLYVNGALQSTTGSSGGGSSFSTIPSNAEFIIGKAFNSSNSERFFKGKIDDVRVYNRKLDNCEIATLYYGDILQDSIIAHYTLDGHAIDSSGNGFHGSIFSATPTSDRNGSSNSALQFDGIDDYVFVGNIFDPSTRSQLSIEAWYYIESPINTENRYVGISMGSKQTGEIGLRVTDGTNKELQAFMSSGTSSSSNSNSSSSTSDNSFTYNTWYHLIATYTDGNIQLYVNGTLQNTVNSNGTGGSFSSIPSLSELLIGKAFNTNNDPRYFRGKIDEVKIHNKALTSCEVDELFQNIILSVPENANETLEKNSLNIFPNPTHGKFTVNTELELNENYQLSILDIGGTIVFKTNINPTTKVFEMELNLEEKLKSGIYFITISNTKEIKQLGKVVLY